MRFPGVRRVVDPVPSTRWLAFGLTGRGRALALGDAGSESSAASELQADEIALSPDLHGREEEVTVRGSPHVFVGRDAGGRVLTPEVVVVGGHDHEAVGERRAQDEARVGDEVTLVVHAADLLRGEDPALPHHDEVLGHRHDRCVVVIVAPLLHRGDEAVVVRGHEHGDEVEQDLGDLSPAHRDVALSGCPAHHVLVGGQSVVVVRPPLDEELGAGVAGLTRPNGRQRTPHRRQGVAVELLGVRPVRAGEDGDEGHHDEESDACTHG